ncbi:MAG: hypothetical protein NT121_20095, partial [Chloroflexi bacterium]|nr:hypothetical protein [Chloroflexota bacterium]
SYATAKQAQAAIEASRTAQIASTGNLITIVTMALVIIVSLVAVVMIAWLVLRAKAQPKRQWTRTSKSPSTTPIFTRLVLSNVGSLFLTLATFDPSRCRDG